MGRVCGQDVALSRIWPGCCRNEWGVSLSRVCDQGVTLMGRVLFGIQSELTSQAWRSAGAFLSLGAGNTCGGIKGREDDSNSNTVTFFERCEKKRKKPAVFYLNGTAELQNPVEPINCKGGQWKIYFNYNNQLRKKTIYLSVTVVLDYHVSILTTFLINSHHYFFLHGSYLLISRTFSCISE